MTSVLSGGQSIYLWSFQQSQRDQNNYKLISTNVKDLYMEALRVGELTGLLSEPTPDGGCVSNIERNDQQGLEAPSRI